MNQYGPFIEDKIVKKVNSYYRYLQFTGHYKLFDFILNTWYFVLRKVCRVVGTYPQF